MTKELQYIAIEGPIGVGKTSLAKSLAGRLGARLVLEQAAGTSGAEVAAMLDRWKKRFAGRKFSRSVELIREDRNR